jgi:outer membrane protein
MQMNRFNPVMALILILAPSLLLLPSGCASVRRARLAQNESQAPAGERTVQAAEVGLEGPAILSLDRAVEIAIADHPAIIQAGLNRAIASNQLAQAQAANLPSASAGVGYRRATANSAGTPASHDSQYAYSAALDADWLLYDFGKTPAGIRQARGRQILANAQYRSAVNTTVLNVRSAFFQRLKAEELLRVATEAVHQAEIYLKQVRAFAEVGRRTRYDVTQAEVNLGNNQLAEVDAHQVLHLASAILNNALGLNEETTYQLAAITNSPFENQKNINPTAPLPQHPDLLALRAQESIASNAVDAAIANLYPSLGLSASYGWAGRNFPLIWNWSTALQSSLSLFDGGAKRAQIDEAANRLRIARTQKAEGEQQLGLQLRQALSRRDTARRQWELSDLLLRQARESFDLIQERYHQGRATSLEVTDAQLVHTRAAADQISARFNYLIALAEIQQTLGMDP